MAKIKLDKSQYIGMTETSDPVFNLDIFDRLYKGNIIITKHLTNKVIEKLVEHKDKCILHCDVTGMGSTKIEPFVPTVEESYNKFKQLIEKGFPIEHVVLRIDPVVPTEKGIQTAKKVLETFKDCGIKRVRFSILDMYKHVKERFNKAGFPIPYNTFHAPYEMRKKVCDMFNEYGEKYNFDVEVCAEPGFESISCLSQKDIDILGLTDKITLVGSAEQRTNCGCPANKRQLCSYSKENKCKHGCLYCYMK